MTRFFVAFVVKPAQERGSFYRVKEETHSRFVDLTTPTWCEASVAELESLLRQDHTLGTQDRLAVTFFSALPSA
jgi:hypothetical protein